MPIIYNVQNDNFNKDLRRVSTIFSGIYHPDENYPTIGMLVIVVITDKDTASYVRLWWSLVDTCQTWVSAVLYFIHVTCTSIQDSSLSVTFISELSDPNPSNKIVL